MLVRKYLFYKTDIKMSYFYIILLSLMIGVRYATDSTICIEKIEVFNKKYLENLIEKLMQKDIRIILTSHMRAHSHEINNIFQNLSK